MGYLALRRGLSTPCSPGTGVWMWPNSCIKLHPPPGVSPPPEKKSAMRKPYIGIVYGENSTVCAIIIFLAIVAYVQIWGLNWKIVFACALLVSFPLFPHSSLFRISGFFLVIIFAFECATERWCDQNTQTGNLYVSLPVPSIEVEVAALNASLFFADLIDVFLFFK